MGTTPEQPRVAPSLPVATNTQTHDRSNIPRIVPPQARPPLDSEHVGEVEARATGMGHVDDPVLGLWWREDGLELRVDLGSPGNRIAGGRETDRGASSRREHREREEK